MKKVDKYFLEALKAFLENRTVDWEASTELDSGFWENLFFLSKKQKVFPMIFESVYDCAAFASFPVKRVGTMKGELFRLIAAEEIRKRLFLDLYEQLLRERVRVFVVKGILCQQLYDRPGYRISSDEDLFVPKSQAEKCHKFLLKKGFETEWRPGHWKEIPGEVTYQNLEMGLILEVHYDLFPGDSKVFREWNVFFKDSFQHPYVEKVQGKKVLTMEPADFFLYLVCHAFKHFLHSGVGIRQVCDIVRYAQCYGASINWKDISDRLTEIRAVGFLQALFAIGERYLAFEREKACLPDGFLEGEKGLSQAFSCEPLLGDILEGGIFGDASLARKHSSTITLNAFAGKRGKKEGQVPILRTVFPERGYLEIRYPYLQKRHFLLPFAWIQRILDYGRELKGQRKEENSAGRSMKIGKKRVALLKEYGALESNHKRRQSHED